MELIFPVNSAPSTITPMVIGFDGQRLATQKAIYLRKGSGQGSWTTAPFKSSITSPGVLGEPVPAWLGENLLVRATESYLQMWEPGLQLYVEDDDSLIFGLSTLIQAKERTGEESLGRYQVTVNRPVPVPVTLRVHSQSRTADSGVDFLPITRNLTVFPSGQTIAGSDTFDLPILPDRKLETEETADLVWDQPSFGQMSAGSTTVTIQDRPPLLSATEGLTLREPAAGTFTQFVRIPLGYTTETPMTVNPLVVTSGTTASTGADFTLPASFTVPAGMDAIAIPITILADGLSEATETLQLQTNPGFYRITVSILDQTAPQVTPKNYSVPQNHPLVADGAGGNPASLLSSGGPNGEFILNYQPYAALINLSASGDFSLTPQPNFMGDLLFSYSIGREFDLIGSAVVWDYLHPVDGIAPQLLDASFAANWKVKGPGTLTWLSGSGALSYGGFGGFTGPSLGLPPSGKRYTAYFHTAFEAPAAATYPLQLKLSYDDAVIVYINGIERGRQAVLPGTSFTTDPDSYTLLSGGIGVGADLDEATVRIIDLGLVPLDAGVNHLAISLHNTAVTSSDLGLKLQSLHVNRLAGPASIRVSVTDAMQPPELQPDAYICPQTGSFQSGDRGSPGLLANDGLLREDGTPFDPITEIIFSPVTTGSLEMIGLGGHFRYTPPPDFSGTAAFTYQVRDKDGLSAPALVTLQVSPALPFDLWREIHTPATAGQSLPPDADPDGDSAGLFMEYAQQRNPLLADNSTFLSAPASGLPVFTVRLRKSADLLSVIERASDPSSQVWTLVLENRGTAARYIPPGEDVSLSNEDAAGFTVTTQAGAAVKQFYRLRVSRLVY